MTTGGDAFGVLVGIKTYNEVSVAGFTTKIIFGSAVGAFVDGSNFLPAGTVTCNTEGLTQNSNNSYVYMPDFGDPTAATGLDLGNEAIWTVSGQGTVPAINESFVGFPSKPSITSSTTINSSADYTMTWSSISGADSLIASVYANNGNVSKTVAGNATSVVFTSSELNGVGTTNFGIIQVAAYKQKKEVVDETNEETPQIIVEEPLSGWSELENI